MKKVINFLVFFFTITSYTQSISTSPYAMYGLGSVYDADFGSLSGIGGSGMALPSDSFINNLNPASLAYMLPNHFMFDIGGKSIFTTFSSNDKTEKRNNWQFSHLAFAFPVTRKSAFSIALKPYSSTSFKIYNLQLPILDSNKYYTLDVLGKGGLNNLDISYGYRLLPKLAIGAKTTFLFGSTNENRDYAIENSITNISQEKYFNGFRGEIGLQYKIDSTLTVASSFKLPAKIKVSKIQSIVTTNVSGTVDVENGESADVDDFYFPIEIGVGLSKTFKRKWVFTADYTKSFWENVNQPLLYGNFVNQDHFASGLSYKKAIRSRNYWDLIKYSLGGNFSNGYLEVNGLRVKEASVSLGASFPLENNYSAINVSYSYGQKARIGDGLIKENYHKISLNISLDGLWFVRRKID